MKKLLLILLIALAGVTAYGQLDTINIGTAANNGSGESLRSAMMKVNDQIQAWNAALMYTLSAAELSVLNGVPATLTATELGYVDGVTSAIQTQLDGKQAMLVSGTNIKTINSNTLLGGGDLVIGSGGTMDYPGAGIALSTGSSWTTSITNNSANWNTAYSWGNWASAVALKVNISDTAAMLVPYINRADTASMLTHYAKDTDVALKVSIADTATMLTKYARKTSPTFTGTVTLPQPFTIGAVSMTSTAAELNVLDGIPGTLTATELGYVDGTTSAIQTQLNSKIGTADTAAMLAPYALLTETSSSTLGTRIDSIVAVLADTLNIETLLQIEFDTDTLADLSDVRAVTADAEQLSDLVPMLTDTIPLFVFGLGSGQTADTVSFNNNAIAGAFYNAGSDTLKVTSLMGVLAEGSGTETISVQVSWHATFKSGSATNLNTSALAITSITTGTSDTSFANSKIPPGVFVWCTLSGVSAGNKPSLLILTMSGYKIPRY